MENDYAASRRTMRAATVSEQKRSLQKQPAKGRVIKQHEANTATISTKTPGLCPGFVSGA